MIKILLVLALLYWARRLLKWRRCRLDFQGKTVFVSGGSSGIGEEMCKQFVKYGAAKVIIAARRIDELERVRQVDPARVQIFQIDLNAPRDVLDKLTVLFAREKVDILVNNGGMSMRDSFEDLDFAVCERMTNVNLLSQIAACKAALPGMKERKYGRIVNIVSGSGVFGNPMRTLYSATKFGLSGFGKALRSEVKPDGVRVLQVYPGYVQTNISRNAITGTGEAFGKLDSNIENGMPVDQAVDYILRGLTLNYTE